MKKGLKIAIIVVVILLILIIGGIAFVYFFTDIFKSNEQMFFKYLSQNSEFSQFIQDSNLQKYVDKQKISPYTTDAKFTVLDDDNNLTNTSISCTGSTDEVNKYEYRNVKLNYSNTDALSIHYLNMQDYYGVKIDNVVNKYIAIENNNLKEFLTKMGIEQNIVEQFPDKINFDNLDLSLFTTQELETLKSKYTTILLNNLTESMFSKSETETSKIYTLTLTQSECMNIIDKLLEELKNDSIIINKLKQEIIENSDCTDEQANEYISDLKSKFEELQDNIRSGSNSSEQVLTMNLYVENKKLNKIELLRSDDSKISVSINNNSYQIDLYEQGETTPIITLKIDKNKSEDVVEYSISISISENSSISSITSSDQNEIKCDIKFSGLSTLEQVTEQGILTIDNKTYTYTNTKQFGNITQENVAVDQMLFLNTAPSSENVKSLFDQISTRIEDITTTYRTNSGFITEQPFLNYGKVMIPYAEVKVIQEPTSPKIAIYLAAGIFGAIGIDTDTDIVSDNSTKQLLAGEEKCNLIATQVTGISEQDVIDDNVIKMINDETNKTEINNALGLTEPGANGVEVDETEHSIKLTCSTGSYVIGISINGVISWSEMVNP